ncbi:hypothetical protein D3C76_1829690 [compost metagenome]
MDRLPNAKIVSEINSGWIIEAEVYGKGCMMWLLSQGDHVEVISPLSIRNQIKNTIQSMSDYYND